MSFDQHRKWWLYILHLENDKFYVGITSKTPEERFREHQLGIRGAYWTKAHKPIEIEKYEELGVVSKQHAEAYENKVTRQLMKERGLNNVRGGDLRDTEEYIQRFGRVYSRERWDTAMTIILLLLIILALVLNTYHWDIRVALYVGLIVLVMQIATRIRAKASR